MKKVISYSSLLLVITILLSGCSNAIPEMDEDTRTMVVNYAADIVQKYDSNHPVKLQSPDIVQEEIIAEDIADDASETMPDEQPVNSGQEVETLENGEQETQIIDNTLENSEITLDDLMMFDDFSFTYVGYETDDFYPTSGTEAYFAMNATEDNKLLVLKFTADNLSGEEKELDMLQSGIKFKVQINGVTKNVLTTMLLNDFMNYHGVITPAESVELVVVCEIPVEMADEIESLSLTVKNVDKSGTISLH